MPPSVPRVAHALAAVREAIAGVDAELRALEEGHRSVSGPAQLGPLRGHLAEMERELEGDALPDAARRERGIGRMITDSWPWDSALGALILEADRRYRSA